MAFLIGTRCENYSRERAAKAIGASIRTTDRALGLLVKMKAIARQRGGRSTPAKLFALMSLQQFVARYVKLARYVDKTGALRVETGAPSRVLNLKEEHKERKGPSLERERTRPRWQPDPVPDDVLAAFAAEHEARRLRLVG